MTLWLHPNVGAEEPPQAKPPAAVACVARLLAGLFPEGTRRTDRPDADAAPQDDLGLGAPPAHRWLAEERGLFAWLNDAGAARAAAERDVPLLGASPEIVRRVHDKAFALEVCREQGYEAPSLRGLVTAFAPEQLADEETCMLRIQRSLADWPEWTGGRFSVKPRLGGSGRGRVAGGPGGDLSELRRALPRLARQGGALLEPWLRRDRDLSAQLHVGEDGAVTLLASLEQRVSGSGVYRGHRGRLDHRLRISSGHPDESDVLEAASAVARAAHAQGFRGPCGVDAFTFHGEHGLELRPVVELNARFTVGTIVSGLLRLARREIKRRLPAEPGQLRSFEFSLTPLEGAQSEDAAAICFPLGSDPGGFAPSLRVRHEG